MVTSTKPPGLRWAWLLVLTAGAHPASPQEGPTGTLVVLNKAAATASLIDAASGRTLAELPTGSGPREVAVSSEGRTAVITNHGSPAAGGSTLTVLDLAMPRVARTIELGMYRRPHGVAFLPGDSLLVIISESSQVVLVIRLADGSVVRALPSGQPGSRTLALTADGRTIYTGNSDGSTVTELDAVAGVRRLFQVPAGPEAIAVTSDGSEVWLGGAAEGTLSVLHTADGRVEAAFDDFARPYRIALIPERGLVAVSDVHGGLLRLVDRRTRREVARLEFPEGGPQGLVVSRDGRWLFQSLGRTDSLAVVDLETFQVVGYLHTGGDPDGVAWSSLVQGQPDRGALLRRRSRETRGASGVS